MLERERSKETIGRGDLFYLTHPHADPIFSGYGLVFVTVCVQYLIRIQLIEYQTAITTTVTNLD